MKLPLWVMLTMLAALAAVRIAEGGAPTVPTSAPQPEIVINFDKDKLARLGLTEKQAADQVSAFLSTSDARKPFSLMDMRLDAGDGKFVNLRDVATFTMTIQSRVMATSSASAPSSTSAPAGKVKPG